MAAEGEFYLHAIHIYIRVKTAKQKTDLDKVRPYFSSPVSNERYAVNVFFFFFGSGGGGGGGGGSRLSSRAKARGCIQEVAISLWMERRI